MMLHSLFNFGHHSNHPSSSDTALSDADLATLEPEYHIAFHQLHGNAANNTVSDTGPVLSPFLKDITVKSVANQLPEMCSYIGDHTTEELQQPARQTPTSRSGHILLSCAARRSLILHGGLGLGSADLLNDTWEYLIDKQRWIQLLCRGVSRGACRSQSGTDRTTNEVEIQGEMPSKAFGQCGALFGGGRYLFVHGGTTSSSSHIFSAYQLDIEQRLWRKLKLIFPLPAMWGSVAQTLLLPVQEVGVNKKDDGKNEVTPQGTQRFMEVIVLFGGMQDAKAFNTTYLLYLTEPPPSSLSRHYKDGDLRVVERLPSLSSKIFPGRRRACSTVCRNFFFFIFGGRDSGFFYNDLWVFNGFTRQWIMVREETPLRYMREFFFRPYDTAPGLRIISFLNNFLKMKQDSRLCMSPTPTPQRCRVHNSSALWRTGAVMMNRGMDIFVLGGFTYDENGVIETHKDVHVYNCMHHVWREVHVDENIMPRAFPDGYFKLLSPSPGEEGEGNAKCVTAPPSEESLFSRNWDKLKGIVSTCPDGRTMAAVCNDPVMPGFRFFMFGGRCGDEPSGELYDFRITMASPANQNVTKMHEEGSTSLCVCRPHSPSSSDETAEATQERLAMSCFMDNRLFDKQEPLHWGGWRLRDQAADWVRALVLEEAMLLRVMNLMIYPNKDAVVRMEWLMDAHQMGSTMSEKVEKKFPRILGAVVSHAPPFIRRG